MRLLLGETSILPESATTAEARALSHDLRAQLDALQTESARRAAGTAQLTKYGAHTSNPVR